MIGDDGSGAGKRSSLKESGTQYCHGISRSLESGAGLGPSYGHGGGTLGFSSRMLWLEETDCVLAVMTNVGGASPPSPDLPAALAVRELANVESFLAGMHSGFGGATPWGLFMGSVLMPALRVYLGEGAPKL